MTLSPISADLSIVNDAVRGIADAWQLNVFGGTHEETLSNEVYAVFVLASPFGRQIKIWANFDGVIRGGVGELAGDFRTAMVRMCVELVRNTRP